MRRLTENMEMVVFLLSGCTRFILRYTKNHSFHSAYMLYNCFCQAHHMEFKKKKKKMFSEGHCKADPDIFTLFFFFFMHRNSAAQHEHFSEVDNFLENIKKEKERKEKKQARDRNLLLNTLALGN